MRTDAEIKAVRDDLDYLLDAARSVGESAEENAEVISAKVALDWVLQEGRSASAAAQMFERLLRRCELIRKSMKARHN